MDFAKDTWGKGTLKSVDALFREIENEDSQLELWGRHDGVPMPLGCRGSNLVVKPSGHPKPRSGSRRQVPCDSIPHTPHGAKADARDARAPVESYFCRSLPEGQVPFQLLGCSLAANMTCTAVQLNVSTCGYWSVGQPNVSWAHVRNRVVSGKRSTALKGIHIYCV